MIEKYVGRGSGIGSGGGRGRESGRLIERDEGRGRGSNFS